MLSRFIPFLPLPPSFPPSLFLSFLFLEGSHFVAQAGLSAHNIPTYLPKG